MPDNNPEIKPTVTPASNEPNKQCQWCKERECLPEMDHCDKLYCIAGMN